MAQATLRDNVFAGNIEEGFLSHNAMTTVNNFYPSAPGPSNLSHHGRGYMPASTMLFGRDPDVDFIVKQLIWQPETPESKHARFSILGPGGMGKTSVALKVMWDAKLLEYYPEHCQAWFPCVQATSFPLLLDTVHSVLDLPSDTKNTLNAVLNELQSLAKPMILLFDNFETPWNAPGAKAEVAQFLRDIDAIPHISVLVTMRAQSPPCEEISWKEMRITPLDPEASFQLYTGIDTKAGDDEKVSELLEMLGYMSLAVKLMARQGNSTGCTAKQLIESYHKIGTAMLGPSGASDAQNSVSISISLSLDSLPIKKEPYAYELLSRISMLPAGTTFEALQSLWAPHIQNLQSPLKALLDTALLEHSTATYSVLPVIRSHLLDCERLPSTVQVSMVDTACRFLQTHNAIQPSLPNYKDNMKARSAEEINLQSILLETTSSEPHFIQALLTLAWHQYQIRPRTEVIQHAVNLMPDITGQKLIGDVFNCYAWILFNLNHWKESLDQFNLARQTYLAASKPQLGALALLNIAIASTLIDSKINEIPLMKQAKLELETIHNSKPNQRWGHFFPSLSTLQNWFKKGTGQPKNTSTKGNKDMARCPIRLGRAYSRQNDHSQAIEHLKHARELCPELCWNGVICTEALAGSYTRLQQYDEAEKWGLLALKNWQEMGESDVSYVLRILGRIYISKSQYDKAAEPLRKGLDIAKARNHEWNVADILLELGRAKMKKGEIEGAQTSFTQALIHFHPLQGVEQFRIVCKFYLAKLENPLLLPTDEELNALQYTWHEEDFPS
ncbi:hypothetical protein C8J56DRAFT_1156620 [Mycena floridula]|nr:hypothetical protein C8J56DRAFT_1156620 [Mycena floridula]